MNHQNEYFPVLDHGFVALKDMMGTDQDIEEMARVSYQAGTRKVSDTKKLLRYLMRHKHTSPFERVEFVFHVGLPIFVARQWIRHRTASVNEYSGRYSVIPMIFYTPEHGRYTTQSQTNKQGSSVELISQESYDYITYTRPYIRTDISELYYDCCQADLAREVARIDLPLSTYTYWYWKIDLHNLFHFLKLRLDTHAQWEIQQYAHIIANIVSKNVPLSWNAFKDYILHGVSFGLPERLVLDKCFVQKLTPHVDTDKVREIATDYLSKREIDEFLDKFIAPNLQLQSLPEPKTSEFFENKIKAASQ